MFVLNLETAALQFKNAEDVSGEEFPGLDSDIDKNQFKKFYDIMCAKCPDDIADISAEEILELWKHIPEYSSYFSQGKLPCNDKILKAAHSMTKRRVL